MTKKKIGLASETNQIFFCFKSIEPTIVRHSLDLEFLILALIFPVSQLTLLTNSYDPFLKNKLVQVVCKQRPALIGWYSTSTLTLTASS